MTRLEPHLFVIFGATGDLTRRKLFPAIYRMMSDDAVHAEVIGVATSEWDDEQFRAAAREALTDAGIPDARAWCEEHVFYHRVGRDEDYGALAERIRAVESRHDLPGNRAFYLALPPSVFPVAIGRLIDAGLDDGPGWTRLVVEKPFGHDLASARELNEAIHTGFDESQVFRIDHYLGKDTVQNLLVFRFTNPLFEGAWNRDRIDRVEITVAESVDVGTRGAYYEASGVVRDMIQNHLTQVLSLIAMEAPTSMHADAVRAEKIKVLESLRRLDPDRVVFGQYGPGVVDGHEVPGYRDLDRVDPASQIATYVAIETYIDNWRWHGVPFYLRTGKAMAERVTEVAVTFKEPPICFFHGEADECPSHADVLYLRLQPDEGFRLDIEVKEPGASNIRTVPLRFRYAEEFGSVPEAYATLLRDVVRGDQTHFVRSDWAEASWRHYEPILDPGVRPERYDAGSWGPDAARRLLDGGRTWSTGA
ncbi:MAG TPA: glucose-6-phosphate dehydrogenase [Acidimicrobiia bacterium]|nr:glucose-6-phosphate dehydrogenase [Acidimicrobiia bacterium]